MGPWSNGAGRSASLEATPSALEVSPWISVTPCSRSGRPPGGSSRPSTPVFRPAKALARLGPGPAPQVGPALAAAAGLPARDRLAVPALRGGDARADPERGAQRLRPRERPPRRDQGHALRAGQPGPRAQDVPDARHVRRPDLDRRRVLAPDREPLPGARLRHPGRRAGPPPRHLDDQVRARRRAHHRPHQPLQHDVQPLLHGREPGRLRPRADHGGDREDPGRLDLVQAAAADVGAVLGRGADALAALPGRLPVREEGRLHDGPGRHQRAALRPRARLRGAGEGSRLRHGLPAVRRRHQRGQLPPQDLEPLRRQEDRHRQHVRGGHQDHARGHDRERPQQRERGPDRGLLHGEPRQGRRPRLPARLLHRPRRGDQRRGAPREALHDLAPGARAVPLLRRPDRPPARLVPARVGRLASPPWPTT